MRRLPLLCICLGLALLPASVPLVRAQSGVTLRLASLAPPGTNWARIFSAWGKALHKRTEGRVEVRLYAGASGDERDILRKIEIGQLDMASLSSVGLGQVVRPVLMMQLPGLFRSYAELTKVRAAMSAEWNAEFERAGFQLLGWGDAGFARMFSKTAIARPGDLRRVRPWVWSDDPVGTELMRAIGANGVPLSAPEVGGALETRMVDTVFASPAVLTALQWFRHFTHMSAQADIALVGATVLRKQTFDALSVEDRAVLLESSARAHEDLVQRIRQLEARAFSSLKSSGITAYDTTPHRAEWDAVYRDLRQRLQGRVYPKQSLVRVEELLAAQRSAP